MEIYRITLTKWSKELKASGFAARWNSDGIHVIYAASSRSLACIENIVRRNKKGLEEDYRCMVIHIPDRSIIKVNISGLAKGWNGRDSAAYNICRKIGDKWAIDNSSLVLEVPSVIIKDETNFLINVNHPDFKKVKLTVTEPFFFDPRIKS